MKKVIFAMSLVAAFAWNCRAFYFAEKAFKAHLKLPDGFSIDVRLAQTPEELAKGLMFVESLPEKSGMLFVFAEDGVKDFWMKNTLIDLDIVFLSLEMEVKKVFHRVPRSSAGRPESEVARVRSQARYVLELAGGSARAHNLKPGSRIQVLGVTKWTTPSAPPPPDKK